MMRVVQPPAQQQTLLSSSPLTTHATKDAATVPEARELCARRIWQSASAVCFDVDSTVCTDEAIDELAAFLGVGDAVAAATARAMNGGLRFREALRARLDIMQPSRAAVEEFAQRPPRLTPGIKELVAALHARGTHVYLVSGGFRRLIRPVADQLAIPHSRIYANEILFNDDVDGCYAGFDDSEPTSDSGSKQVGKAGVCGALKTRHGYTSLVMVGDGATDAEAAPPADAFIGFGGNQVRDAVKKSADWYVMSFETLRKALL